MFSQEKTKVANHTNKAALCIAVCIHKITFSMLFPVVKRCEYLLIMYSYDYKGESKKKCKEIKEAIKSFTVILW